MHQCFRSSRPSGVYGLSGQLHQPGMQFQVTRSLSCVALSGQFSAGTCRVQGGMRGRVRGVGQRDLVWAAGAFVVRPCDVPAAMPGPAFAHISRAPVLCGAGARLRAALTGRYATRACFPGFSPRAGGAGLTGRNRRVSPAGRITGRRIIRSCLFESGPVRCDVRKGLAQRKTCHMQILTMFRDGRAKLGW